MDESCVCERGELTVGRQSTGAAPDFVGYEYTSVRVGGAHESMVVDAYRNFGWLPDGFGRGGMLNFKRDRNLLNRTKLIRLQRQFDAHMRELETLEQAPVRKSSIVGLCVGLVGCVFLGGATFAYLNGLMVLMVAPAVPGFLCWLGAGLLAKRMRRITVERNGPAIELDELVLRVEALLRRAGIEENKQLKVGGLVLDAGEMSAQWDGRPVELTVREFNILYKLLSYPRQVFSRGQLMDEFWGQDADNNLRVTDVYITRLRAKFADCPYFTIQTVRGLGYKAVPNQ
ncbi:response regulator transcription factor [Bifidobacterium sp. 82T24]|uniref:winged helix-turn-helix domain-containing protein n=1 Tax=Bifidobacterium pluvialisilvae TaxID=2834436 RepID=UPI001C58EBF4|nr:response regulator transcription factor [Bifidobacterium pluvialisilvae]MBW3088219.1 response regulator transcription factor [Bifidobacterium pluvialisilvae]